MTEVPAVATPGAQPETVPASTPASPRPNRKVTVLLALLAFATTGVVSFGLIAKRVALWKADMVVPFEYAHDSFLIHCWVKTLVDTGWWMTTDRCGAPLGHEMYDFPTNPNIHFAGIKLLTAFTTEPGMLMNLYYLLGFPLAGLTAHAALRSMKVSHWACIVGAVLYAHQPYHYWRGIDHLFLGTYFLLPLATMVMVWVFRGEPLLIARNVAGRLRPVFNWRTAVALLVMAVEGFDFPYYPIFAGFFMLVTGLAGTALNRDRIVLLRAGALLVVLVSAFAVNMYPNLAYYAKNGMNKADDHFTKRPWSDGEAFALMPVQMLLPPMGHPIKALDKLQAKYYEGTKYQSEGTSSPTGMAGVIGFLVLLVSLATQFRSNANRGRVLFLLGLLLVAGILFCTAGGFGTLFNLLSITIARTYVRVSIFLAFFCLAGFALVLDIGYQWALSRWRWVGAGAVFAVSAALITLGYKDQTGMSFLENYSNAKVEFHNDREYVTKVEEVIPRDGAVFQLPYIAFGSYQNQLGKMEPYAHFGPYVHARTSRWSFGAMYGRPEEAELAKFGRLPLDEQLPVLLAYGYAGVSVDRFGYNDNAVALEKQLREMTQAEPVVSPSGRLAFYPLDKYEARVKGNTSTDRWETWKQDFRSYIHSSPVTRWGEGFDEEERSTNPGWERHRWARSPASVRLTNPTDQPQRVRIRFAVRTQNAGTWNLAVEGAGLSETMTVGTDLTSFDRTIELPPGQHTVKFTCDATPFNAGARIIVFNLNQPTIELADTPPRMPGN